MKKQKAEEHLRFCREHLEYLRSSYVERMRNQNFQNLNNYAWVGVNPYEEWLADIKQDMKDIKERIAKFERIVL